MAASFLIILNSGGVRIASAGPDRSPVADVPLAPDAAPGDAADAISGALRAAGYADRPAVLALPSEWCLCALLRADDLPTKGRHRAMLFRLEESLPVSAEDVVADFIPAGADALGVCVERRKLGPLIEALEARGVAIEAICPAALLALQLTLEHSKDGRAQAADAVVCSAGGRAELFLVRDGRPRAWYLLAGGAKDLLLHLKMEFLDGVKAMRVVTVGANRAMRGALGSLPGVVVDASADDIGAVSDTGDIDLPGAAADRAVESRAAAMAGLILSGQAQLWVNLRRDALAPRDRMRTVRTPLLLAAAAIAACLLTTCAAMLWRASRYDRLAARHADEQQDVFREVFPGRAAPADVRSRLLSEERALRGLSGDPAAPPPEAPGLLALRDLLAGLPDDVRYRVLELRLDGGKFVLEGQANTHGDADAIAAALRRAPGAFVEPPRTEQLPLADGAEGRPAVAFVITGSVGIATPAAARSPAARGATR